MGLNAMYDQARALGCILAIGNLDKEDYEIVAYHGDPCRGKADGKPCRKFNSGKCLCYLAHHTAAQARQAGNKLTAIANKMPNHRGLVGGDLQGLSMSAIAQKLGVSKGAARKLKQEGRLINGTPIG